MNIELAWPWALAALPIPLLVAVVMRPAPQGSPTALRLPFYEAITAMSGQSSARRSRWRLLFATLAWLLLVIAAARPQFLGDPLELPISGRDLLLAVDISGSMETEDMLVSNRLTSRLTAVKVVAGNFIEQRKGDRLGLILFGDQAYLQTPLSFDRVTVRTQLDEAAIGLAGKRTAIGDAIGLGIKRLRDRSQENRVMILLTDGSNTAGNIDPLKAADIAAAEGVRIYTIGVGADEQIVQGLFGARRVANTEIDESTLKAIAQKTGGRYFRARDTTGLAKIYQLLDQLEAVSRDEQVFRPVHELYRWPLASALLISVVFALVISGKLRRPGLRALYRD